MGFFIDNKLIDCSLICNPESIDSEISTQFFSFFSEMKMHEEISLLQLFENFGYKLNIDIKLSSFYKLFHSMKYAIYKYYNDAKNSDSNEMIIFYYFEKNLIPMVKKVSYVNGLYESNIQEYAFCDTGGLKRKVLNIINIQNNFFVDFNNLSSIVPLINSFTTPGPSVQIFISAVTQKIDYLEYLYLFHKTIYELKTHSMKYGITLRIYVEQNRLNYSFSKHGLIDFSSISFFIKDFRSNRITGNYFVEDRTNYLYKNLLKCTSFKSATAFTFPSIEKEKLLPRIIPYIKSFLADLPLHKPVSFFSFVTELDSAITSIEIELELFHFLKHSICKYNESNSNDFVALSYDKNKTPFIIKLNSSKEPDYLKDESQNILEFRRILFEYIQDVDGYVTFSIDLHNLGNFDDILNVVLKNDLHFQAPMYYWEYLYVITTIANNYPSLIELNKEKKGSKTTFQYKKIEQIITKDVTIPLTELQIKLCVWLAYKGKADLSQIRNFLNHYEKNDDIFYSSFYPLYQKGLIEIGTLNQKVYYICNFNTDSIQNATITIHYENSEYQILKTFRSIPSFKQLIRNQKLQLAKVNFYYDFQSRKFIPSEKSKSKIGLGQVYPYSSEYIFKFNISEMYVLNTSDNPELRKIALCVHRRIDETLYHSYRKMFIIQHNELHITPYFLNAIPIPILRLLCKLDPEILETDFSSNEIVFRNISQSFIKELQRIFSNKLFYIGDIND